MEFWTYSLYMSILVYNLLFQKLELVHVILLNNK